MNIKDDKKLNKEYKSFGVSRNDLVKAEILSKKEALRVSDEEMKNIAEYLISNDFWSRIRPAAWIYLKNK